MKFVLALLLLISTQAIAQPIVDIFVDPPLEVRMRAAEMDINSDIMTLHTGDIQRFCGDNYGCFAYGEDGVCRVYVWLILPENMKLMAQRNLMARCTGWTD